MSRDKACQPDFAHECDDYPCERTQVPAPPVLFERFDSLDVSCQTHFSLDNLANAVVSNNVHVVREILVESSISWIDLDYLFYLEELVLLITSNRKNEKIHELLITFLQFGIKDDFVNRMVIPVLKGDVDLLKSLLVGLEEKKFKFNNWCPQSVAALLFNRRNLAARKDLLKLLISDGFHFSNILDIFIDLFVEKDDTDAAEIANMLVNMGDPLNEDGNLTGNTPLVWAVWSENFQLVKLLINRGADVNLRVGYNNGTSPLIEAVSLKDEGIMMLLLESGADVNLANEDILGTPLHHACWGNDPGRIKFLIRQGADVAAQDFFGDIPFSYLEPAEDNYKQRVEVMVNELAKLVFRDHAASAKIRQSVQAVPSAAVYLQKCVSELEWMKNSTFYASYSYYNVLEKSIILKKLALLTKNEELVKKFRIETSGFACYKEDLLEILNEAEEYKNKMQAVKTRLLSIFRGALPSLVIDNLAFNLTIED